MCLANGEGSPSAHQTKTLKNLLFKRIADFQMAYDFLSKYKNNSLNTLGFLSHINVHQIGKLDTWGINPLCTYNCNMIF